MLLFLYHKFTLHYPGFLFGYKVTDLAIKLSVLDKRSGRARKSLLELESSQDELKLAWYTLLKELDPHVQATEAK